MHARGGPVAFLFEPDTRATRPCCERGRRLPQSPVARLPIDINTVKSQIRVARWERIPAVSSFVSANKLSASIAGVWCV